MHVVPFLIFYEPVEKNIVQMCTQNVHVEW